jgi:hypothetical protein
MIEQAEGVAVRQSVLCCAGSPTRRREGVPTIVSLSASGRDECSQRPGYKAVTEYTGGSRAATLPHVAPASPEPNSSPDVAPK